MDDFGPIIVVGACIIAGLTVCLGLAFYLVCKGLSVLRESKIKQRALEMKIKEEWSIPGPLPFKTDKEWAELREKVAEAEAIAKKYHDSRLDI